MADDTPQTNELQPQPDPVIPAGATLIVPPPVVLPVQGLDETQPGGRYIVSGQAVDAEGNPVKEKRR